MRMWQLCWSLRSLAAVSYTHLSALTKYSLGSSDLQYSARGLLIAEKAIELADDLGIRIVMIPGYDVYYETSTAKTQQRYIRNLKKVADIAASYGVIIGLETMENCFMNTVWKACLVYTSICV